MFCFQASATGGLGSVKAEVMADTAVALASANVQVVSRKVIGRLDSVRHGNCFLCSKNYTWYKVNCFFQFWLVEEKIALQGPSQRIFILAPTSQATNEELSRKKNQKWSLGFFQWTSRLLHRKNNSCQNIVKILRYFIWNLYNNYIKIILFQNTPIFLLWPLQSVTATNTLPFQNTKLFPLEPLHANTVSKTLLLQNTQIFPLQPLQPIDIPSKTLTCVLRPLQPL